MHSIKPHGTAPWDRDDKGLENLGMEFSRGLREKPKQAKSRSGWERGGFLEGSMLSCIFSFSKECTVLTASLGCPFKSIAVTRPVRVITTSFL